MVLRAPSSKSRQTPTKADRLAAHVSARELQIAVVAVIDETNPPGCEFDGDVNDSPVGACASSTRHPTQLISIFDFSITLPPLFTSTFRLPVPVKVLI